MTEPTVLRGREISTVWLGLSGAWTWRGAAGARPKLGREKPPQGWQGEQVLTWWAPQVLELGQWLARSLSSRPASPQAQAQAKGQALDLRPLALNGHEDGRNLRLAAGLKPTSAPRSPLGSALGRSNKHGLAPSCPQGASSNTRGL